MEYVKHRAVISGGIIEIYEYSEGYAKGYKDKFHVSGRRKDYVSPNYSENREKTLQRARTNLRRTINSNANQYGKITSKFLTLTFAGNEQDLGYANGEFTKFIKRLNYYIFKSKRSILKYSAVVEFQDRGAIHYHIVVYNMPYVAAAKINSLWSHGNINVKMIEHIDNIGSYLCKYMTKENDNPLLQGKKCYFNSRGLKKPIELTDKKEVKALLKSLPLIHLKFKTNFFNEHLGDVSYYQFNISYYNDKVFSDKFNLGNTEYTA